MEDLPFNILALLAFAVCKTFRAARNEILRIEYHTHSDVLLRVETSLPCRRQVNILQGGRVLDCELSFLNLGTSGTNVLEIAVEDGFQSLENQSAGA